MIGASNGCRASRCTLFRATTVVRIVVSGGAEAEARESTPPIGSRSLDNGSSMAVPLAPNTTTSFVVMGVECSVAGGLTLNRMVPADCCRPCRIVNGTW